MPDIQPRSAVSPAPSTHVLHLSLSTLLRCRGADGLNDILDASLSDANISGSPTDVSYETFAISDEGDVMVRATFTLEPDEPGEQINADGGRPGDSQEMLGALERVRDADDRELGPELIRGVAEQLVEQGDVEPEELFGMIDQASDS